jgi:hypothetical protein
MGFNGEVQGLEEEIGRFVDVRNGNVFGNPLEGSIAIDHCLPDGHAWKGVTDLTKVKVEVHV